ncbi:Asp-tRNA(Asn)/Glu-tRNA(Gln) amidotransferase subunit GatC [Candidatus Gottesmanbacteria bacterium]|nr:Asp-tRNA(Asn)/Glu-tRNA(Gln) amidotransferase subunit GatC [Candidatus Gottesmanbacteria bacterium]
MAHKKLTRFEIKHVAKLSNLLLSDPELELLGKELSETIEFIDHLSEINTDDTPPTSQVGGKTNEFREDHVLPGLSQKEALKNAKRTHNGYFVSKIQWS